MCLLPLFLPSHQGYVKSWTVVCSVALQQLKPVAVLIFFISVIGFVSKKDGQSCQRSVGLSLWEHQSMLSWLENIDFWIVRMHFCKKTKTKPNNKKNICILHECSIWHYNNVCIKYMLISVTCAIQVRLLRMFLLEVISIWSLSHVNLCHLYVI